MGLFSGLFRARDAPQNRTSGSAYSFFMGGSTSGKRVNERSSMQMTAVYSCVRILSEAVAGLPLHMYRYTDNGGKEKAAEHPLYFLLHDEPNPEMTSFVFRETLMSHLLIVRAKPCLPLCSFSLIRKTELWETNKPPAVRVVEVALAYSIKPPVI